MQSHVAARARRLARSVIKDAQQLVCLRQVRIYAGNAIRRQEQEHVHDAKRNVQPRISTSNTFPFTMPKKSNSCCAKVAPRKAKGLSIEIRSVPSLFLGGWVATSRPMLTLVIGGIATHRLLSTSVHLFCSSSKIVLAIVFLFHSPTEFCIIMGTTLHRIIHAFPHHLLSFSGEPLPTLSIPGSSSASLSSSLEEPLHHVSLLYA